MNADRPEGFYWVRTDEDWVVTKWCHGWVDNDLVIESYWCFPGVPTDENPNIIEVDERRLERLK